MITDKETHHFCKDCKLFQVPIYPNDPVPFRCTATGNAVSRYQVICDAERNRRLRTGKLPARKLPWYMIYIENTSLSRKPG